MSRLDGIDVFVEVADAKSFTGAALRLGMPTTTVSAKISRLEDRLGVTLLRRTTRKLSLTEAGERYYAECAPALKAVQQAETALRDVSNEPNGTLRMTAPPDIAQMVLGPVLNVYMQKYPKVHVDLHVTNSFVDLVAEKIDLAIRIGHLSESSLVIRKFTTGRLKLWAHPSYIAEHGQPERPEDLDNHRLIWLRTRQKEIELTDSDKGRVILTSRDWLDVDDLQTLRHYVDSGLGLGLLPQFDSPGCQAFENLTPVLPRYRTTAFNAVFAYPQQSFVPMTIRSFIDTAIDVVRR